MISKALFFLTALIILSPSLVESEAPTTPNTQFRVCADPNNLPYSNQKLEGFENKLVDLLAKELKQEVTYTWWPQRRGFIRNTLAAGRCDVVMGIPENVDAVLTTKPYYRSAYVFVSPKAANYNIISFDDPQLQSLKIGVHLIGDDYSNSPPAHLLSSKGIVKNVVGYSIFGNYGEDSPPGKIIKAVADGEVNVAIVWGPIAGYFAQKQSVPLTITPVPTEASLPTLPFAYRIALGVRRGDTQLREKLNDLLNRKSQEINKILTEYGVPIIQDLRTER
ncbi:MAG: quinoprotein dehydrogenase-associated putative ABC transporter substrate-binding protein [Deltaproteobacteria bacterium]|nr:quinoprotein dehydrogenase-associated putative ABC transporter substrate-binding protein [Deltaproteobacteria bacterium]